MKKNLFFGFMIISIAVIFTGCDRNTIPTANALKISKVIAFGDSYTDNGASMKISRKIMALPNKPADAYLLPADPTSNLYWEGHWSNGPTAVEVLAEGLQVELENYAVGGAKSGNDNYYEWINKVENTGALGQIEVFKSELNGKKADSKALYFIFISANDYFQYMDYGLPGTISDLADRAVSNIYTAVSKLVSIGAKQFMIVNSTDLSIVPWEVANNRTQKAKQFTEEVNQGLVENMPSFEKEVNADILLFDHTAVSAKIRSNPGQFGLKELNKPFELTYPEIKISAGNPDEHYFWDEWHPTKVVHRVVGEEMLNSLQN